MFYLHRLWKAPMKFCDEILNPKVHRALRLSSIRKDGVHPLPIVLNEARKATLVDYLNILPKGKRQAKPEAVAYPNLQIFLGHHYVSFYDILGVSRNATPTELKKAFYAFAKKHHPDMNKDDPDAESKFQEINKAYEVLKDDQQRAAYDQIELNKAWKATLVDYPNILPKGKRQAKPEAATLPNPRDTDIGEMKQQDLADITMDDLFDPYQTETMAYTSFERFDVEGEEGMQMQFPSHDEHVVIPNTLYQYRLWLQNSFDIVLRGQMNRKHDKAESSLKIKYPLDLPNLELLPGIIRSFAQRCAHGIHLSYPFPTRVLTYHTWYTTGLYNRLQKILLVGEGDFSFSSCLATEFGIAQDMLATSLDSRDMVIKNYSKGMVNLRNLEERDALVLHRVDARLLMMHPEISARCFDVIVYNFPHVGGPLVSESARWYIRKNQELVLQFFKAAKELLRQDGEVHLRHKRGGPYDKWDVQYLAEVAGLKLSREVAFHKSEYPGYENKLAYGDNWDDTFNLGRASTYVFISSN